MKLFIASISLSFLITGCSSHYADYTRIHNKPIDAYYNQKPTKKYKELTKISVVFKEFGAFTGKGSDEMIIKMLKDKASELGADGIIDVEVITKSISLEYNLQWTGRAIAIKYNM